MARWQAWKSLCVGALFAGLVSSHAMAADPVLSVTASPTTPVPGGQVTVNVNISGISDLFAYQFALEFNPSFLQGVSGVQGPFLPAVGSTTFGASVVSSPTAYFVYGSLFGTGPGASGSGVLATLTFNVLGNQYGSFAVSDVLFLNSSLQPITVVPEPSAALLLAAGLAGVGALRLRKARTVAA